MINPERLHSLDTTVISIPHGVDGCEVPVQKYRDGLKYLTAMEDESAVYLMLGVENQSEIHYAMPVKNMVYDALQYAQQVEHIAKVHRNARRKGNLTEKQKINNGEYLTGFYKTDRLVPVITLVVYFNSEVWDGPMCLHDMFTVEDKNILNFVSDYKINLLSPANMTDEQISRFKTNLREVMLFIKYSKDKDRLKDILQKDERFQRMERNAAMVIKVVTGSEFNIENEREVLNVCQAIEDMKKEAMEDGIQTGIQSGIFEGKRVMILGLLESGDVAYETIAKAAALTVGEIKAIDEERLKVGTESQCAL